MSWKLKEKADKLLSYEKGTVYKNPGGRISIALIYPNTYSVGMSNLGFQGIYGMLNQMDTVVCERVFLPEKDDLAEYSRTGTELFSMESKRPVNRFDIAAFSVSFENDYPNIAAILRLANIPLRASDRTGLHPLVIMGGVCAFFNPEPVADFFDICFTGEAEEMLAEFLDLFMSSQDREYLLRNSMKTEGLYVPKFYSVSYDEAGMISSRHNAVGAPAFINKRILKDLSRSCITTAIITKETEFSGMYLIEAMRGCPWSCRFCMTGRIYRPVRKKDLGAITKEIETAQGLAERIGLIGPSLSDYPGIQKILGIPGTEFSITSLRASTNSAGLVRFMKGHRSISIAPEAGTERLRQVINKKITEDDIITTASLILAEGIETLRLYFMVGLPTETREDILGIAGLVKKVRENSSKGYITLSVSTFVPKPFTPFQWHPMEDLQEVRERLNLISRELRHVKGVKVFHDVPKYAGMQGLFSLGDRRIAGVLEKMRGSNDWIKAAAASGVSVEDILFRKKGFGEILPWDFIDAGISREHLWSEYEDALQKT
jgi:radical SAM superfamily enzyme YgiQ (UPF0313 family)